MHPTEKSTVSARATSYRMAPGCAGQEYSFLSSGLWKPESFEVSSVTPLQLLSTPSSSRRDVIQSERRLRTRLG